MSSDIVSRSVAQVRRTRLRTAASKFILWRVAGDDPFAVRNKIHAPAGPRWFEPGSAAARVYGDASMFPGGVTALLLQSLHPRAMAAVAEHSGYQADPWGRLQRTATFLATTTFARAEDAERAVAIVRKVHSRISGVTPDGEPYEASDPHLLSWVHVAEIYSFLAAHQSYGREPLDDDARDEYVAQAAIVARKLGAVDVPTSYAEMIAQLEAYRPELRATPAAIATADFLLKHPPIPWFSRPPYRVLANAGIELLPDWAREPLGLRSVTGPRRALVRAGGALATRGIRWALDGAPAIIREDDPSGSVS